MRSEVGDTACRAALARTLDVVVLGGRKRNGTGDVIMARGGSRTTAKGGLIRS